MAALGGERVGLYRRRLVEGRRTHRTVIRHTDEEWARVQALARVQGVSVPRLYERSLHAGDVVVAARLSRLVGEMAPVLRLMAGAAGNLNQLARVANATGDVAGLQVLAAARHFDVQVERVKAALAAVSHGDLFSDSSLSSSSSPLSPSSLFSTSAEPSSGSESTDIDVAEDATGDATGDAAGDAVGDAVGDAGEGTGGSAGEGRADVGVEP